MKIIENKILPPRGYCAISLFGLLFTRKRSDIGSVTINHESIHWKQQKEMLIVPFFVWYFAEYLVRLAQHKNHDEAYRNISFEREAYGKENDFNYVFGMNTRKVLAWWGYLKTRNS
jgi:hypothetical protein